MSKLVSILFFFGLFILLGQSSYAQSYEHKLIHNGEKRIYLVHLPVNFNKNNMYPVVLILHGGGGNAKAMAEKTNFSKTADRHGFIAVYPEGTGRRFHTWNGEGCCGKAYKNNVDDVGFISNLIDKLMTDYNIDEKRVYVTGLSNGAMMSYRLSCDLSEKITAIAPVASQNVPSECFPERHVPTLHFHGNKDQCALYDGGNCGGCFSNVLRSIFIPVSKETWPCRPVVQTLESRAKQYGCYAQPKIIWQHGDTKCQSWTQCSQDTEVTLCTIEGGGHNWPNEAVLARSCQKRPNGRICKAIQKNTGHVTRDIDTNEVMWKFFSKYTLP